MSLMDGQIKTAARKSEAFLLVVDKFDLTEALHPSWCGVFFAQLVFFSLRGSPGSSTPSYVRKSPARRVLRSILDLFENGAQLKRVDRFDRSRD